MVITTGRGPQEKVMTPPAATAATTAAEVQLAAVPLPMVRAGCEASAARPAAGTAAWPCGFPAVNATPAAFGGRVAVAWGRGLLVGWPMAGGGVVAVARADGEAAPVLAPPEAVGPPAVATGPPDAPHPVRTAPATKQLSTQKTAREYDTARC
jgi:hypothetical protein